MDELAYPKPVKQIKSKYKWVKKKKPKSKEEQALIKELHSKPQKCVACGKIVKKFSIHRKKRGSQGGKYEEGNVAIMCTDDDSMLHGHPDQFRRLYGVDLYLELLPSLKRKEWIK